MGARAPRDKPSPYTWEDYSQDEAVGGTEGELGDGALEELTPGWAAVGRPWAAPASEPWRRSLWAFSTRCLGPLEVNASFHSGPPLTPKPFS